ncbi:hypothetical protein [Prochlorococcus marinus]|uniref:Uncharacterized protein n=1 Tax=Prochlorococcus marinus XMU1408 TaxID=2213228 RepID=A0A318R1P0_PROMR|nr:hypothetical protein [Prochlorococcus marinus]PYE01077.1 hypothetical protein DNJ73_06490 [Prochlorococcus marinus XMU1408]
MLFFYVGLGFAMYTATLGIFEMSLAISKQRFMSNTNILNPQDINTKKNNDKVFLSLIESLKDFNSSSDLDDLEINLQDDICLDISYSMLNENGKYSSILNSPDYTDISSYNPGIKSYSTHSKFINSCSLVNNFHRVIISYDNSNIDEYSYYSCIIDMDPICRFELVD